MHGAGDEIALLPHLLCAAKTSSGAARLLLLLSLAPIGTSRSPEAVKYIHSSRRLCLTRQPASPETPWASSHFSCPSFQASPPLFPLPSTYTCFVASLVANEGGAERAQRASRGRDSTHAATQMQVIQPFVLQVWLGSGLPDFGVIQGHRNRASS